MLAAMLSRPAIAGGSSGDKSALVRYKLSHGYLVGDQARTLLELEEVRFTFAGGAADAPASDAAAAPGDEG